MPRMCPPGFLPATGRLEHLRFGEGARADTGVGPGDEISPWYDPMIAKLIVHGPTREIALKQMDRALATTEVAGATTNLAFLRRLVGHGRFASGDVDTGLIEADLDALVAPPPARPPVIARAALAAMGLDGDPAPYRASASGRPCGRACADAGGERDGRRRGTLGPDRAVCVIGEDRCEMRGDAGWRPEGGGPILRAVRCRGASWSMTATRTGSTCPTRSISRRRPGGGGGRIEAPMPGLVKAVFVARATGVAKGARLAVLEAMKMEHVLTAGRDGVVAEVLVAEGSQVEAGAALIVLEEEDAA
jgi:3-methylcrotonyl-CoA carboxylase alpha subunit